MASRFGEIPNRGQMAHKRLSRMKSIGPDITGKLGTKGIFTCKDFLTRNRLELMDILDITYPYLQKVNSAVSNASAPLSKTVLEMYQSRKTNGKGVLPTSIPQLDFILKGGLPPSTITEICGPPGCGKTQLCIMLSALSALPEEVGGRGTPVIYIDTEGAFSAGRLIEMGRYHLRLPGVSSSTNNKPDNSSEAERTESHLLELARNVHVYKEMTCKNFQECLEGLEIAITSNGSGLVVVDSIASLARKEYDTSTHRGIVERTEMLLQQSARLKYLAESFDIQVVVTNQTVAKQSHCDQKIGEMYMDKDMSVVTSALGNAWYHSVNTRLLLDYRDGQDRKLTVLKSPMCGRSSISVVIGEMGFISKTDEDEGDLTWSTGFHKGFPLEFPGLH